MIVQSCVFLSHDLADFTVAFALRHFLESTFVGLEVNISCVDQDSELSLERSLAPLRRSDLVVCLLSRHALANPRIYFEAGAGSVTGRTRVICMDGVRSYDLAAPLTHLPMLTLEEHGVRKLLEELARLGGFQMPERYTGHEELLWSIKSFLSLRNTEEDLASRPGFTMGPEGTREAVDKAISSFYKRLKEQLRQVIIKSVLKHERVGDIASRETLRTMTQLELLELAHRNNLPVPETERMWVQAFEQAVPTDHSPRWRKMNACKLLEAVDEGLRRFERAL